MARNQSKLFYNCSEVCIQIVIYYLKVLTCILMRYQDYEIFFSNLSKQWKHFKFLIIFFKILSSSQKWFFSMEKSRFSLQTNESDFEYLIFENDVTEYNVTENNVTLYFRFLHLLWSSNIWKEFIITMTEHS